MRFGSLKSAQLSDLQSQASDWLLGALILALIKFYRGAVLGLCPKCGVMMIYAHLKYWRASELKGSARHKQTN